LDRPSLSDALKSLLDKGLSESELSEKLILIKSEYGLQLGEVKDLFKTIQNENETVNNRDDNLEDIKRLLTAKKTSIGLDIFLPKPLADGLTKRANLMGLRPEVFATSLICGLSGQCNRNSVLLVSPALGFKVTPNLFGGIVASSSQKKTPVVNSTIADALFTIQGEYQDKYKSEKSNYEAQLKLYNALSKDKKKNVEDEFPNGEPTAPMNEVAIITNTTIEALSHYISNQEQGLTLCYDELAALFKSAGQYKGGKGGDEEFILSLADGGGGSVARKGDGLTVVTKSCVSIFGAIQPKVLQKLFGTGDDSNGQWARFLWVEQPLSKGTYPLSGSVDISPMILSLYRAFITHAKDKSHSHHYTVSNESAVAYQWFYEYCEDQRLRAGEDNPMGYVYSKSQGKAAKLALVIHLIKHLFDGLPVPTQIENDSMSQAITLADFYINQSDSLYLQLVNKGRSLAPELAKIVTYCENHGGV